MVDIIIIVKEASIQLEKQNKKGELTINQKKKQKFDPGQERKKETCLK